MTETGPREIKALVPTLRGASNWHDWYRDLEKFLASKEENLWPIFTGAYHRPANIDPTNVAEISAAINKLQDETDQVAAFRASMAFIEMKDPDTVPTPLITADIALRHRARKQKEWDSLDRTVLDYIRAAVSAPIAVHVTYGVTSHAVHNQLRHVYGSPSLKMRHNMYAKWTQYRYKGSNPDELVRIWRQALQDILDMHPDHVNPDWVSYYQFIQAIASFRVNLDTNTSSPNSLHSNTVVLPPVGIKPHEYIAHDYIAHEYIAHDYIAHDYIAHDYIAHDYIAHEYIAHEYIAHDYIAHEYIAHEYIAHEYIAHDYIAQC